MDTFQEQVLDFLDAARGRAIYADPMGARKTGTTLSWLARTPVGRTLVVAPGAVNGHWAREAARFYPEASVYSWRGTPKQREVISELVATETDPTLVITTYATMNNDERYLREFDSVVFDEGHRLKGRRTQVALAANAITKDAKHVLCVTGTPILNHPHELWQYLHMIDRRAYSSFWTWAARFFIIELKQFKGQRQATRIIHGFLPGMEEVLRNELLGVMIQRELSEMFDVDEHPWIVEPEHIEVPVTLTPAERKLYDKLVKDLWGKTPTGELINAGNKLVVTTRLRQMSSDWGTLDANLDKGAKVTAAAELIPDLVERGPVIVFAQFKETVHRLAVELRKSKLRVAEWTGDTPTATKEDTLFRFPRGQIDVVVGTIASLGEGVDGLQYRSHQVVLLDRDWRALINDQAVGRARRSGQAQRVEVYHLFATGTIDEGVHAANAHKLNFVQTLKGRKLLDVLYGRSVAKALDPIDEDFEIEVTA